MLSITMNRKNIGRTNHLILSRRFNKSPNRLALTSALIFIFVFCFLFSPVFAENSSSKHKIKAILITEDGANAETVLALIKAGKLPNLEKLNSMGGHSEFVVTNFPSKTAPSHASLFCGCFGDVHGISSNRVQKGVEHNILQTSSGFNGKNLTAEPVWVTASKQGLKTVVLHSPLSSPASKYINDRNKENLVIFEGYPYMKTPFKVLNSRSLSKDKVKWQNLPKHEGVIKTGSFKVGDTVLYLALIDENINGKKDFSSIVIGRKKDFQDADTVILNKEKDRKYSKHILVKYGKEYTGVNFQYLSLNESGDKFRIVQSATYLEKINGQPVGKDYVEKTGGFIGNGAVSLYFKGKLGRPAYKGGDGTAEERYIESVRLINGNLAKKLKYAAKNYQPDFLMGYTPYPDETLHMWLGLSDYNRSGLEPVHTVFMGSCLWKVFQSADDYLGAVLDVASPETYIAAASDHGMDSYNKLFYPNTVLKEAGLIVLKNGKIDLSKTKIIYGKEGGGFLRVNSTRYKEGIVKPEDEESVIRQAVSALSKIRDPHTGEALVTGFYYPNIDGKRFGIGGVKGGDVYLDILPGYYFSGGFNNKPVKKVRPGGQHIYMPRRKPIHSMFYFKGPGIKSGTVLKEHRIIDIIPTLCHWLGIEPPANATGKLQAQEK